MEFKTDKPYTFPELMAYGFSKSGPLVLADCHLYLGENSFDAVLALSGEAFQTVIRRSDDKSGAFLKACGEWFESESTDIFLPDRFPEPVHCKLSGLEFYFIKSEIEHDEFGTERIYYFSLEPRRA